MYYCNYCFKNKLDNETGKVVKCFFKTDLLNDYIRHIKTKKHIKNEEHNNQHGEFVCEHGNCGKKFCKDEYENHLEVNQALFFKEIWDKETGETIGYNRDKPIEPFMKNIYYKNGVSCNNFIYEGKRYRDKDHYMKELNKSQDREEIREEKKSLKRQQYIKMKIQYHREQIKKLEKQLL
jgi:hypothetical protein|tara:strand:- start:1047 stop:1583 length:537 start_codon:yes stop_codon:yes gene_type:complete